MFVQQPQNIGTRSIQWHALSFAENVAKLSTSDLLCILSGLLSHGRCMAPQAWREQMLQTDEDFFNKIAKGQAPKFAPLLQGLRISFLLAAGTIPNWNFGP